MGKSLLRFRLDAFRRQAGRCYYCTAPMWHEDCRAFAREYNLPERVCRQLQCTAEHLHARSDGGPDSRDNIVAACRWCNLRRHKGRKAAPSPGAFKTLVRRRLSLGRWHCSQILERGLVAVNAPPVCPTWTTASGSPPSTD